MRSEKDMMDAQGAAVVAENLVLVLHIISFQSNRSVLKITRSFSFGGPAYTVRLCIIIIYNEKNGNQKINIGQQHGLMRPF